MVEMNFKNPKDQIARWLENSNSLQYTDSEPRMETLMACPEYPARGRRVHRRIARRVSAVSRPNTAMSGQELALYQSEDPYTNLLISWVKAGKRPPRRKIESIDPLMSSLWGQFGRLKLLDAMVCFIVSIRPRMVNPL